MDYRESPSTLALAPWLKATWTLDAGGRRGEWIAHKATPDGCVEIIRRLAGASRCSGEQPEMFIFGLNDGAIEFEISGDARFAGVRLWPWAWSLLGHGSLSRIRGGWIAAESGFAHALATALPDVGKVHALLAPRIRAANPEHSRIASAVLDASSVEAMVRNSGLTPRRLQRWFARHVGMAPRRYLRLLRFQQAFATITLDSALSQLAAAHGFADQAHMAREFRAMAGVAARQARDAAAGPFLSVSTRVRLR